MVEWCGITFKIALRLTAERIFFSCLCTWKEPPVCQLYFMNLIFQSTSYFFYLPFILQKTSDFDFTSYFGFIYRIIFSSIYRGGIAVLLKELCIWIFSRFLRMFLKCWCQRRSYFLLNVIAVLYFFWRPKLNPDYAHGLR